jgi:deoxyribose-phosphate aldolase
MEYKIKQYLDATYLKTAEQAKLSTKENLAVVESSIQEAIQEGFKLIMIRPEHVALARHMVADAKSKLLVGTVIDFPKGQNNIEDKLIEAEKAINEGVDELDYVVNYEAFKLGEIDYVKDQVLKGTKFGLNNNKTVKWIIETAALNDSQIIQLTTLIKNVVVSNFKEDQYDKVFVKSSTGFYVTHDGSTNGATFPVIVLMLENAFPLSVKASGGVKNIDDAIKMIKLGVKRIGTSSAKDIANGTILNSDY